MSQPAKLQEPSMEEILASIRRIIADDDDGVRPAPVPAKPEVVPVPEPALAAADRGDVDEMMFGFDNPQTPGVAANDVFELRESVPPKPFEFSGSDAGSDEMFEDAQDAPEELAEPAKPESAKAEPAKPEQAKPESAKAEPAKPESARPEPARSEPRSAPAASPAILRTPSEAALLSPRTSAAVDMAFNTLAHTVLVQNSRTIEDLVREMLKPMLKAWLDDNLPNMVERLVRAEIDRVSRGRA
jgi:cell pole-organizing protein PopZ